MVRLKVNIQTIVYDISYISIPYGAIKRRHTDTCKSAIYKFQFLMVRLKDIMLSRRNSQNAKFQFLMVRLKVC